AGGQADSGVSGLGTEMNGFDSDANSNTANSRVASNLGDASSRLSSDSLSGSDLSNKLTASPGAGGPGTTGQLGNNGTTNAGDNIRVKAAENMKVELLLGNLGVGLVGAGASVAVLSLSGDVEAKAGGQLRAGDTITVDAKFDQDVKVTSVALQGGFVGLGASV